mgnify:CR=1 FL=1
MAKFPGLNIGKDSDIGNLMSKNILGGKSFDKFRTGGNGTAGDSLLLMQEEDNQTQVDPALVLSLQ